MKNTYLLLVLIGLSATNITAQESINTTGGNGSGTNGSVSYSIGQPFQLYQNNGTENTLEGVQQPYEISIFTSISEKGNTLFDVSIYPNPTSDLLIIETKETVENNLTYQLIDTNGKLIVSGNMQNTTTQINLKNISNALYFLKIYNSTNELESYKIIKTK